MIRIFIGTSPDGMDTEAEITLEHSIRSRTKELVWIEYMRKSGDRSSFWHGWKSEGWATPFSGFRWGIPERCGFDGRAIYMDVDMLCRADVAELWNMPLNGKKLMYKEPGSEKFCVTLFDCAACKGTIMPAAALKTDNGSHRTMRRMFAQNPQWVVGFPADANWNCLDGENYQDARDPRIKLIHFTRIPTQPHFKYAWPRLRAEGQSHWYSGNIESHPRKDIVALWDEDFAQARIIYQAA
jgi:hypothetical protein